MDKVTENKDISYPSNKIDVCMQVFGKPYQTALTLLTLDQYSRNFINKIYFTIEPALPIFEKNILQNLAALVPNMHIFMPNIWIGLDSYKPNMLKDIKYRQSIRYQYGWESSESDFMLLIHNDVIFKIDIILPFLTNIGDNIAIGQIGQCWNCPAHYEQITQQTGINGGNPCTPYTYKTCVCNYDQLLDAYKLCRKNKFPLRAKAIEAMQKEYRIKPYPLPECRMNEWCTLINLKIAREVTMPKGNGRPFGIYQAGQDLGVAWFRDMNHQGYGFKHMDIYPYIKHTPGHKALFNEQLYLDREKEAAELIKKLYPEKLNFLKERGFVIN